MELILIKKNDYTYVSKLANERQGFDEQHIVHVRNIIEDIKKQGDSAISIYTEKYDKIFLSANQFLVTKEEFDEAEKLIDSKLLDSIKLTIKNITSYQNMLKEKSISETSEGITLGNLVRPLEKVGIYIPAGSAPLFSTVCMTVIPAKVAGVKEIIVVTPPNKEGKVNPYILAASKMCGVDKVYKIGGVQAIAALAYGTHTIPKVDKIVGPGNIFVAIAKKEVYGHVDIDMVAGPSEILVVADEKANSDYIAADLMSQAEHDTMAASYLICFSEDFAKKVLKSYEEILKIMPRYEIIKESWHKNAKAFIVEDIAQAVDIINIIAPEHLELCIEKPEKIIDDVKNAGAIFLGNYTPEAIGDYIAGPSHVLPTSGSARYFSPLSVKNFYKNTSLISYSKDAFFKYSEHASKMAEMEGLFAHKISVDIRRKKNVKD